LKELKSTRWVRPFFLYYLVLIIGMIYTTEIDNGIFTLDKKITYVLLPLIAVTGRPLDKNTFAFLKRSFVYSCALVIFLCLILSAVDYFSGGSAPFNFDLGSKAKFNELHGEASSAWMHFSYIQLTRWAGLHPVYFSMYLVFCMVILFTDNFLIAKKSISIFFGIVIISFIALLSARMAILAFGFSAIYLVVKKIQEKKINSAFLIVAVILMLGFLL